MNIPALTGGAGGPAIGGATSGGGQGDWIVNFGTGNAGAAAKGVDAYLPWLLAGVAVVVAWRIGRRR